MGVRSKMPVVKGRVGENSVVLRDTGCSGIVVKKDLVSEDQFTGDFNIVHRQHGKESAYHKD